jgi:hypothetical protein
LKTWIVIPYALTSFLAAALLFSAEPMIGKMALPPLGGTPAVWNTCLLFFQGSLLAGYLLAMAAAWADAIRPSVRPSVGSFGGVGRPAPSAGSFGGDGRPAPNITTTAWAVLIALGFLLVVGYAVQPISLGLDRPDGKYPAISLLASLVAAAALPLALIAATSPLSQHWFARTDHPRAHDPYFLYAASNAGSLSALLAYPLWIEPNLSLTAQTHIWRQAYAAFAVLLLVCGILAMRRGSTASTDVADAGESPTLRDWLRWIALAAIPSSWLLGVTTFLTTNLAAMPLLWVIPLAVFLIAFILAFAGSTRPIARRTSRLFPWAALAVVLVQLAGFVHVVWLPLHLGAFFLGCLVCNVGLAGSRPSARYTTSFYLAIALGGVLGGAFNALAAPAVFNGLAEYPLAVVCGCLVFTRVKADPIGSPWRLLMLPSLLLACALPLTLGLFNSNESLIGVFLLVAASGLGVYATVKAGDQPVRFALTVGAILLAGAAATDPAGTTLFRSRDFHGLVRVTFDREANCRRLLHGGTLHGEQSLDPVMRLEPRTYFTRSGPVGDIFRIRRAASAGDVAVVGLGIGTLAAYAEPGENWTFYELDPTVVRIARDPACFSYLAESRAESQEFVTGDARVRIRESTDRQFSLIVLDAFAADAVPVHLISREAIRLYLSKLAPGGLLVFNITNGYVDFEEVIGLQAADAGLACRVRRDVRTSPDERKLGKRGSIWAVMGRAEADLRDLADDPRWRPPRTRPGARPWTDDYSDLASYLLIFRGRE